MSKTININSRELRITGVTPVLKKPIINICAHLGVDISDFIKTKLYDIVHAYPELMKKEMDHDAA